MPATTPTSFVIAARACPWQGVPGIGGGIGYSNFDSVLLTWALGGVDWVNVQQKKEGVWENVVNPGNNNLAGITSMALGALVGVGAFRIRAVNSGGPSAWSAELPFVPSSGAITAATLPPPPIAVAENTATRTRINWTDSLDREAYFEVELDNFTTGQTRIYGCPVFAHEFARTLDTDGVLSQCAYAARVRAVSNRNTLAQYVYGAWSAELFFTTPAPVIALIGLPATVDFWRNASSGSYVIATNTAPTTRTVGTLPAGLTHTAGVISGTPTAAVGSTAVSITVANASGTDTKTLTIVIREPALALRFALPGGVFADAATASANGTGRGILAAAMTVQVQATALGPVATTPLTLTLAAAPAWLTVAGSTLTGTPVSPGVWDVLVTGSNGTQTTTATFRVEVADVDILSPDSLTVREQEPFTFELSAVPSTAVFSASGLPGWLSLAGHTLAGTPPTPGDVSLLFAATLGSYSTIQRFTLHVEPVLVGPAAGGSGASEVSGWMGDPLIEALYYLGGCTIEHWYLSGQPPGVELGTLTCPGAYGDGKAVAIVGAPTAFGIFEAVVTAQACCGGVPKLYRLPIRFTISGGSFLDWFHADGWRRELQVHLRTSEVHSFYETPEAVLWLKRGDHAKLHVIFRDGPFADGRLGRKAFTSGITELRLCIRPEGDFDGAPYIELLSTATATVAGHTLAIFDFDVTGDELETAFEQLNKARGANPAAIGIRASGELAWKHDGTPTTSRTFVVVIAQDIDR